MLKTTFIPTFEEIDGIFVLETAVFRKLSIV